MVFPALTPSMPIARWILLTLIAALLAAVPAGAQAAETEMVGLLAVAVEPDVAKQLGLSEEQLSRLIDLLDEREMDGFSKAMKLAKKPREERVAAFADFRAESERRALAILTEKQAGQLREFAANKEDQALKPAEPTADAAEPEAISDERAGQPDDAPPATEQEVPDEQAESSPTEEPNETISQPEVPGDGKLSFNFSQQPWGEVIKWFAERADLSLVVDTPPPGTLNYRDDRRYTPAEALDVLNGVLLTKGYTLVRKERMLLVIDLEQDVIPPNVVTDVPLNELDERGEYELIRVLIELGDVDVTAAADSVQRLVGPQGSVVVLPEAKMLQVTETGGRIRTMLAVIEAMRRASEPLAGEEVQLRSYPTGGADAATMLAVLQTLLEGSPTTRLAVDDQTASLIALATPTEHESIQQTLDKLRTDGRRVELIPVTTVDPLVAATLVTRLFDPNASDEKKRDPNAPIVEADRYTDSLLVRGTSAQVEQIKQLVQQLDTPDASAAPGAGGTIRTLPVTGPELEQALDQIETLWPSLRSNPLRLSTPNDGIPSFRPGAEVEREQFQGQDPLNRLDDVQPERTPKKSASRLRRSPFRFANQPAEDAAGGPAASGADPVYISPGVGTTVIASRDVEALDVLESLLATVLNAPASGDRQYAVFYLKFSEATTAAALLNSIFGGESGGGGSLMGDLAGAAIGGADGDLLGGLLGGGGASESVGFSSVSVDIVPDVRLNALYVRAAGVDLQLINQLLRVIDQPRGPDPIESTGLPRLIRLENTSATDVATVVRQVFADRLGGGGGGEPNPRDLLKALQGGGDAADEQEPEQMTLSIDERSNSLVVRSSEPLFEQVKSLVLQLDRAGVERPVATRVVSLRNTSSDALRETLLSLLGDKAVVGGGEPSDKSATQGKPAAKPASESNDAQQKARDARRQLEGLQRMQQAMERFRRQQGEGGGRRGGRQRGGGQQRAGGRPQ